MVRKHCAISADGEKLLENAVTRLGLFARAHDRILKVTRTYRRSGCRSRHTSQASKWSDPIPDTRPQLLGV